MNNYNPIVEDFEEEDVNDELYFYLNELNEELDEELEEEFSDWEDDYALISSPVKVKKMKKNFYR